MSRQLARVLDEAVYSDYCTVMYRYHMYCVKSDAPVLYKILGVILYRSASVLFQLKSLSEQLLVKLKVLFSTSS